MMCNEIDVATSQIVTFTIILNYFLLSISHYDDKMIIYFIKIKQKISNKSKIFGKIEDYASIKQKY